MHFLKLYCQFSLTKKHISIPLTFFPDNIFNEFKHNNRYGQLDKTGFTGIMISPNRELSQLFCRHFVDSR